MFESRSSKKKIFHSLITLIILKTIIYINDAFNRIPEFLIHLFWCWRKINNHSINIIIYSIRNISSVFILCMCITIYILQPTIFIIIFFSLPLNKHNYLARLEIMIPKTISKIAVWKLANNSSRIKFNNTNFRKHTKQK